MYGAMMLLWWLISTILEHAKVKGVRAVVLIVTIFTAVIIVSYLISLLLETTH